MRTHDGTGRSTPLGATVVDGGVNFSLFSRHATGVELVFFDREDDATPSRVFALDPIANRTYHYWHAFVPGVRPGQIYAYRVSGPSDPASGLRFDPAKVLLDPYGREVVVPDGYSREAASRAGDNAATAMKSVVVDPASYDWEGDTPLHLPSSRTIVYEMHVRGFTRHPSSGVDARRRGTYAGLVDKIPYLRALGITAVELLPVFQNHPVVRRLIVDSLRYWVSEMHVDGFRFDLASILSRDSAGHVLPNPPVLWDSRA
jgi:glycogen operon protein